MLGKQIRGRLLKAVPIAEGEFWHELYVFSPTSAEMQVSNMLRTVRMATKAYLQWGKRA